MKEKSSSEVARNTLAQYYLSGAIIINIFQSKKKKNRGDIKDTWRLGEHNRLAPLELNGSKVSADTEVVIHHFW